MNVSTICILNKLYYDVIFELPISSTKYDPSLQSPTLSSSTHSPKDRSEVKNRPTALGLPPPSYTPNCDNLAALLGCSIDSSHLGNAQTGSVMNGYHHQLKTEPQTYDTPAGYELYQSAFVPPLPDYPNHSMASEGPSYAAMTPITPAPSSSDFHSSTSSSESAGSSPVLPICPVPSTRTFEFALGASATPVEAANQGVYGNSLSPFPTPTSPLKPPSVVSVQNGQCNSVPSLLEDLAKNLPDEIQWQAYLMHRVRASRGDFFSIANNIINIALLEHVNWAKNAFIFLLGDAFTNEVEDQMEMLQCWGQLHVLDYTYHATRAAFHGQVVTGDNIPFSIATVALLGLEELKERWDNVIRQLKVLNFDRYDYAAMKYIMLLNPELPKLKNKGIVEEARKNVIRAWIAYRQYLVDSTPERKSPFQTAMEAIKKLADDGQEYLHYKYTGSLNRQINLEQNLLGEMLEIGAKSRETQGNSSSCGIPPLRL